MFCRSYDYLDPFDMFGGDIYTSSGEINRNSFAPVSDRAKRALDNVSSVNPRVKWARRLTWYTDFAS